MWSSCANVVLLKQLQVIFKAYQNFIEMEFGKNKPVILFFERISIKPPVRIWKRFLYKKLWPFKFGYFLYVWFQIKTMLFNIMYILFTIIKFLLVNQAIAHDFLRNWNIVEYRVLAPYLIFSRMNIIKLELSIVELQCKFQIKPIVIEDFIQTNKIFFDNTY